jgi:hypothetical protein
VNCVRGGPKHSTKVTSPTRVRRSRSQITDSPCPFRAVINELKDTKKWSLVLKNDSHSHGAADRADVFAVHRRNTRNPIPGIQHLIHTDADAFIEPKRSWQTINRLHSTSLVTLKDVQNQRLKYQALMDEGLPTIQALIRGLGDQFVHVECLDESHRLVHILFFQYT